MLQKQEKKKKKKEKLTSEWVLGHTQPRKGNKMSHEWVHVAREKQKLKYKKELKWSAFKILLTILGNVLPKLSSWRRDWSSGSPKLKMCLQEDLAILISLWIKLTQFWNNDKDDGK